MRRPIAALVLILALTAPAAAQIEASAGRIAVSVALKPLDLLLGDLTAKLRFFNGCIQALEVRRLDLARRSALREELARLIPAVDALAIQKGTVIRLLSDSDKTLADVRIAARNLSARLHAVSALLKASPTLQAALPEGALSGLQQVLREKGELDQTIMALPAGALDDASRDRLNQNYRALQGELAMLRDDLRALERRAADG